MRNSRRLATIGVSIVATGALLGGTATAQTTANASAYGGTASSDSLTISLFGQTITTSAASAELTSALAKSSATQVLTPLQQGVVTAETTTVGDAKTVKPEACSGSQLTAIPLINRADITCGEASVQLLQDGGKARGLGAEVVLEPSVANLLEALQLQQPVQGGTNQLIEALNPLFEGLTGTPLAPVVTGATDTVRDVLGDVLTLQSTVRIVVAPALAEVNADANQVTSHARAQGVRIELFPADGAGATNNLLPDDLAAGEPLITITVGDAQATKTVKRNGSGETTTTQNGALVTITFGTNTLTEALGVPSTITVNAGQSFCIPGLEGTPLETCVKVASAGVDAQGNPFADGTTVQLLRGINGGIDLTTGRAVTGGEAVAAPAAAAPAEAPAGTLPRTGGAATLPLVGGALLALAAAGRRIVVGRS